MDDGSFVVAAACERGLELLRYSPEEGVFWRRRLLRGSDPRGGPFVSISSDRTILVEELYDDGASNVVVLLAVDLDGELLWAERITDFSSEEGDLVPVDRELEPVDAPLVLDRPCQ